MGGVNDRAAPVKILPSDLVCEPTMDHQHIGGPHKRGEHSGLDGRGSRVMRPSIVKRVDKRYPPQDPVRSHERKPCCRPRRAGRATRPRRWSHEHMLRPVRVDDVTVSRRQQRQGSERSFNHLCDASLAKAFRQQMVIRIPRRPKWHHTNARKPGLRARFAISGGGVSHDTYRSKVSGGHNRRRGPRTPSPIVHDATDHRPR